MKVGNLVQWCEADDLTMKVKVARTCIYPQRGTLRDYGRFDVYLAREIP